MQTYKKIKPLYKIKFRELRTQQMQKIIDANNTLTLSSLSKIKLLFSQLYKYGMENDIVNKNYSDFIILPKQKSKLKDSFTELELAKIEKAIPTIPFADVILAMCYT